MFLKKAKEASSRENASFVSRQVLEKARSPCNNLIGKEALSCP
jgi:hypothetical protein